jgi:hypothetical protein
MAAAAGLQPYVEEIHVHLDRELMDPNRFGYAELRGEMMCVEITTRVRTARCRATLAVENNYPMMRITSFA